jgi:hypothetical protein
MAFSVNLKTKGMVLYISALSRKILMISVEFIVIDIIDVDPNDDLLLFSKIYKVLSNFNIRDPHSISSHTPVSKNSQSVLRLSETTTRSLKI